MSVMPNCSRISNTGAPVRRKLAHVDRSAATAPSSRAKGTTAAAWLCTTAMHIGALRVDLAVDEALEIGRARVAVLHVRLEVEGLDVVARDELRRERARKQEAVGRGRGGAR